jgi:uroporphyrinogen decarboxylase
MMNRRSFLSGAVATGFALTKPLFGRKSGSTPLSHKERVDKALRGEDVDRPPFTFYHHYKRPTAQLEAQDHLEFHRLYKTDIVKVMNDFDYPQSTTGRWYELKPLDSPYVLRWFARGLKPSQFPLVTHSSGLADYAQSMRL